MQPRRLRPVAALTLALVAAPFLAATAVAAQVDTRPPARTIGVHRVTWLSATNVSVQKAVDAIVFTAARTPVPPPLPDITDLSTWTWPGKGPITSSFGRRWGRMHQGVDIDAAYGSAVVAAQRGRVIAAGWGQTGYGRVVQIDHGNGLTTLYAHLSSISVTAGQVVAQGDRIGAVGASGSVTAAHLHYEVHVGGVPRNPMPWLVHARGSSAGGHPG